VLIGLIILVGLLFGARQLIHHDAPVTEHAQAAATAAGESSPSPTPTTADSGLQRSISDWAAQQSFSTSVVVHELTGQHRSASYQPTASVVPASTYKIYVADAVLHGVEQGTYTLTTTTDDGHDIQTDLSNMILNSDNDAARTLGFMVGWKNINALLQTQGATATNLYNYVPPSTQPVGDKHTTAQDLATITTKLYAGQLLNPSHTQLLLGLMKQQHYRERIPAGVPSGVAVADKPGWLSPADGENGYIENDAAIVYGPKSTYLLVVTTTSHTTQPLASLSKLIYQRLES